MKTIKNLIGLGTLAFIMFGAQSALAYVPGVWDPTPRIADNQPAFYQVPVYRDAPVVAEPHTTTVATTQNTSTTNTTNTTTAPRRVATATVVRRNVVSNISTNQDNQPSMNQLPPVVYSNQNPNGLTALSVAGSGGFMPSSIWQWFLVILLILAIIVIARMLTRSTHTEVHTVTAH